MTKTECPTPQILRQYVLGDCSDAASDDLERHLAECPTCETTIAEFDSANDTLLRHLPLAGAACHEIPVPPRGWIDMLRRCSPAGERGNAWEGAVGRESQPEGAESTTPLADGFANYEIVGELGRGGMGIVFLARHKQLHRRVALKVVRPEALSSLVARRRFQREIQILGGLHHPGIVMATDAGIVGRGAYLVMEWIDGVDFGRVVREGGPLTIETACEAGRQIAEALAAAHSSGVVHRDVKPSNTMVDTAGRVRLLDFGLAHMTRIVQDSGDTSVGRLLGTLDYMAPEQAAGEGQVDARADLYGLGAMLFFLLTGQPPHGSRAGRPILEHIRVISQEDVRRISVTRVDLPAELDQLIARLLSRDPAQRPDSASNVAAQLSRWAGGDLAARVIEFQAELSIPAAESADCAAAEQSLAKLLGNDLSTPSPVAAAPPGQNRHRRWWTMLVPLGAILCATVILWVMTSQGTLKIESDVGGISVELVDAQNRVRELSIREGENETILSTGQYRIRIAGQHDDLELDRDAITLRRGDDVLARITRLAKGEAVPSTTEKPAVAERLYQGRSNSEWQQQFMLETDPLAKLDAAGALLSLCSMLPPSELLERILNVGEELARGSFDDPLVEYALQNGVDTPFQSAVGNMGGNDFNRLARFQNTVNDLISKVPPADRATGLSQALLKGNDAQAAFASVLLRQPGLSPSEITADPSAVQTILTTLDVPLQGFDRSALCQLIRMYYIFYARDATAEQRSSVLAAWRQLATLVINIPAAEIQHQTLRRQIRNDLLTVARSVYRLDSTADFRELAARLVLNEITELPYVVHIRFPREVSPEKAGAMPMGGMSGLGMGGMGGGIGGGFDPNSLPMYNQERVVAVRQFMDYFLDSWLNIANGYLVQHREALTDQGPGSVIQSLDATLPLYSEGDDWPVDKTAELLAEIFQTCYVDDPAQVVDQGIDQLLPATPATLLTQIVRITGRVPDFVHTEHNRSARVAKNLKQLERLLKKRDQSSGEEFHEYGKELLTTAPCEVLRLICEAELPSKEGSNFVNRGKYWPMTPPGILSALADAGGNLWNPTASPRIDPLVMLVILADLTGKTAEQDAGLAKLMHYEIQGISYRGQLKHLLASDLKPRQFALESLQEMAKRSRSEELTAVIHELIPDVAEPATRK